MLLTWLGFVLLPIVAILVLTYRLKWLLWGAVFFAPFSAAAVINIPAITAGIQPGHVFGAAFILIAAGTKLSSVSEPLTREIRIIYGVMIVLLFFATLSVVMVPFYEPVTVRSPGGDVRPLQFQREQVTQLMYLWFGIFLAAAFSLRRVTTRDLIALRRVFLLSTAFVVLWGWFQLAAHHSGIPYPSELFNNNFSYSQQFEQSVGGRKRMNSVSPEPSMFAMYLVVPIAFLTTEAILRPRISYLSLIFTLALVATALASTSTTAIVGVVMTFIICLWIAGTMKAGFNYVRIVRRRWVGVGVAVAAGAISWAVANALIFLITVEKVGSTSATTRLGGALDALQLYVAYPVLGVGWGSNRSFDILSNTLANIGTVGSVLFFGLHAIILLYGIRALRALGPEQEVFRTIGASLLAAFLCRFMVKFISEPGVTLIDYWIATGFALAIIGTAPTLTASRDSAVKNPA